MPETHRIKQLISPMRSTETSRKAALPTKLSLTSDDKVQSSPGAIRATRKAASCSQVGGIINSRRAGDDYKHALNSEEEQEGGNH
jgi:hypothetical protein